MNNSFGKRLVKMLWQTFRLLLNKILERVLPPKDFIPCINKNVLLMPKTHRAKKKRKNGFPCE